MPFTMMDSKNALRDSEISMAFCENFQQLLIYREARMPAENFSGGGQ